ncbi:cytochrome c [Elioraea tepidiphila]|mgnify:CR=1 FL=1|jgi:mono/diheme cytochrome c family protein|uniref:c-type cytochrome n=1 Tax=Elioraea tepidiphila TaxID=457934 RepID=UPI002FD95A9E
MPARSARLAGRAVTVAAVPLAVAAGAQQPGDVARGRALAETNCGGCHAVGPTGRSAMPAAPPFRALHRRYPVEQRAEALAEGITTGHAAMPAFQLAPAQIEALIA